MNWYHRPSHSADSGTPKKARKTPHAPLRTSAIGTKAKNAPASGSASTHTYSRRVCGSLTIHR
jgi:hypothetical protein